MSLNIPFGTKILNAHSDNNEWYGTYNNTSSAVSAVPLGVRALGLTVGIIVNLKVKEYWWEAGIDNVDLVEKVPTIENLPTSVITSGTFADARISQSSVAQYLDNYATNNYVNSTFLTLSQYNNEKKFKGSYTTLSALEAAVPTAAVGDYANVDAGVGSPTKRYIWDNDDSEWIASDSLLGIQSVNGILPNGAGQVFLTKNNLSLGNVDNTSDLNKPLSNASINALLTKESVLTFGTGLTRVGNNVTVGDNNMNVNANIQFGISSADFEDNSSFSYSLGGYTTSINNRTGVGTLFSQDANFITFVSYYDNFSRNTFISIEEDSVFNDGSAVKTGLRYAGFGETSPNSTDGGYSQLVATSLVPKQFVINYVSNAISAIPTNTPSLQTVLNQGSVFSGSKELNIVMTDTIDTGRFSTLYWGASALTYLSSRKGVSNNLTYKETILTFDPNRLQFRALKGNGTSNDVISLTIVTEATSGMSLGIAVTDEVYSKGLTYRANYSVAGEQDNLWIPSWGSVKAYADSVGAGAGYSTTDFNVDFDTKNLSDLDETTTIKYFTQSEKTKLAGLESSKYLGQFTSLANLNSAFPSGVAGNYADVDLGVSSDIVRYIWDTNDSKFVQQLGIGTQETNASIKIKYEANSDTNAFTDNLLTKLNNIQAGAQVNVVPSLSDVMTVGRTANVPAASVFSISAINTTSGYNASIGIESVVSGGAAIGLSITNRTNVNDNVGLFFDGDGSITGVAGSVALVDNRINKTSILLEGYTTAQINNLPGNALITKSYVDAQTSGDLTEIKNITASTYTVIESDNKKILVFANSCTVTLPNSLPIGTELAMQNKVTANTITVTAEGTLQGDAIITGEYAHGSFYKETATIWTSIIGGSINLSSYLQKGENEAISGYYAFTNTNGLSTNTITALGNGLTVKGEFTSNPSSTVSYEILGAEDKVYLMRNGTGGAIRIKDMGTSNPSFFNGYAQIFAKDGTLYGKASTGTALIDLLAGNTTALSNGSIPGYNGITKSFYNSGLVTREGGFASSRAWISRTEEFANSSGSSGTTFSQVISPKDLTLNGDGYGGAFKAELTVITTTSQTQTENFIVDVELNCIYLRNSSTLDFTIILLSSPVITKHGRGKGTEVIEINTTSTGLLEFSMTGMSNEFTQTEVLVKSVVVGKD